MKIEGSSGGDSPAEEDIRTGGEKGGMSRWLKRLAVVIPSTIKE